MRNLFETFIDVGSGLILSTLIQFVDLSFCDVLCYNGNIVWDTSKPNGMLRKVLDVSKLNSLGWKPKVSIREGIQLVSNYLESQHGKK